MNFAAAEKEDREEILALYQSLVGTEFCAWTENYPNEDTIDGDMSRGGLFCLKEDRDGIIGVISIDDDKEVEKLNCWSKALTPSAELSRLGVRVDYQNKGIARKLLQLGMKELKNRGMKGVHFLVCKSNRKAIRSYDKLSCDIVGECELFGEQWWCYEKKL